MFFVVVDGADLRSLRCVLVSLFVPHPVRVHDIANVRAGATTGKVAQLLRVTGHAGHATGSDAIIRGLARFAKDLGGSAIYGTTTFHEAQIDEWLAKALRFDVMLVVASCKSTPAAPTTNDAAVPGLQRLLDDLDSHLTHNTFLCGHRLTVADVAWFASVHHAISPTLDAASTRWNRSDLKPGPAVKRWSRCLREYIVAVFRKRTAVASGDWEVVDHPVVKACMAQIAEGGSWLE